jgi:hypothetical protein
VKRKLMRTISRSYRAGDRLPSVRDLSRLLAVAPNTAHEAMRELAREGVLELHPRRGAYVAAGASQPAAVAGASASRGVLAYFMLRDQFVIDMYEGFHARAQQLRLPLRAMVNPDQHVDLPDDQAAAVIFNPGREWAIRCRPDQSVIIVGTSTQHPPLPTKRIDMVSVDQALGGRIAGEAMRKLGVTEAYFVGVADRGPRGLNVRPTCTLRLAGFEAGLGRPVRREHRSYQSAYGVPPGIAAAREYLALARRPRGIFCSTDELLAGFVKQIRQAGLRPGVDCHLIGFDGQQRAADILGQPPATVLVPGREMGAKAADMLVERLNDPDQVPRQLLLGCTLRHGFTLG